MSCSPPARARHGDTGTPGRGDTETRGRGDAGTRGSGDTGTRGKNTASPRRRVTASARQLITAHLMSLMQRGFTRLYANGQTIDLSSPDDYPRDDFDDVYVLVDRLTARPDVRQRLVDSLEICFREGQGSAIIETADAKPQRLPFQIGSSASTTLLFTPYPNRDSSVSTIRTARAQHARDSATQLDSISIS